MAKNFDDRWWWWFSLGELDGIRAASGNLGDGASKFHRITDPTWKKHIEAAVDANDAKLVNERLSEWFSDYPDVISAAEEKDSFWPRAYLFDEGKKGYDDQLDALEAYNYGFVCGMVDYVVEKYSWPEWKQRHKFII